MLMDQLTKPNDNGEDSNSKNEVDPHAYILHPQVFVHPIGAPSELISIFAHAPGFNIHFVDSFAALLCSLDVLPHDVNGIVDLLVEPLN